MRTFVDAAALAERVRGPVYLPGGDGFAQETAAWNTAVVHRPEIVVGAADAADVAATVRWAVRHGLPVAVHSTGHGPLAPVDGGVLVTTRRMTGVRVDPQHRTVRVDAGVTWQAVIDAAAPHGLAPLNGSSPLVGAVGYTLGGGLGVLARQYGFAADHVRRIEIVTADGQLRTVDAAHDPELFWALRGAGKGRFGIVTAIELDLVPVTRLYGGGIFFPASAAADVLHAFRSWVGTLTGRTTTSVALLRLPPLPHLPEPLRGQFVVHLRVAHLGDAVEGERLLAPMRAVAPALVDTVGEMPYPAMAAIHADPTDPMPTHEAGVVLRDLPAEAVDALLAVAGPEFDVPLMMVELRLLGGALAQPAVVPNAVSGREGAFSLLAVGPLMPGLEQVVPAVVRSVLDAVEPFAASTALANFHGAAVPVGRDFGGWSPADRDRLARIRAEYDPTGVFAPVTASSRTSDSSHWSDHEPHHVRPARGLPGSHRRRDRRPFGLRSW
ncbi:FAD-binding oxidoreductase [Micromonospora echinofusca]|uniref:FAD-binding protein n=1 Tax=Micromonospora echinofusca TaxID=47858 RepID=A0ABS3W0W4_MICEH|nr:FAD-binding oxidoreductase [Micromonospora echinofusca]MBO4210432.1 FAD-binding protein [Micromonospora echinofusca]